MRLCFVCSEYPPGPHGGIGTMVQMLGTGLADAGHEVRVLGVYPAGYPAPDYEEDHGVRVWRLRERTRRGRWIVDRFHVFRILSQWSRAGEIDVIEVPDFDAPAACWPSLPVPVIARLHGSMSYFNAEMGKSLGLRTYWLERFSLLRADYICSTSSYTAVQTKKLFRLTKEVSDVLYNPVRVDHPRPTTVRPGTTVVYAGTLTPKKGIVSLIRAWPLVLESVGKAELHVYGKDVRGAQGSSMRDDLRALIPGRVGESVIFHGHVSRQQLMETYASARVAVFPSYAEAFALAPLEAMVAGCPTIYSSRGSGSELMRDGEHGLLIDPDDYRGIAAAIVRVLTDDALAEHLGGAGYERVAAQFSLKVMLIKNEEFYSRCIDDFSKREAA